MKFILHIIVCFLVVLTVPAAAEQAGKTLTAKKVEATIALR